MCNLIKTYSEHSDVILQNSETQSLKKNYYSSLFPKKHRGKDTSKSCYVISRDNDEEEFNLITSYFVGIGWIEENNKYINIVPKLNNESKEIDVVKMLFSSMNNYNISNEIDELFVIKWEESFIEINQKQDMLTPFLVMEFLGVLKKIVRKGLRKSYYKVEENLQSRVKGKVMVGKTIKKNQMQNKNLHTYCSYEEFGINNKENRLLKKALEFVKRYLPTYSGLINSNKENLLQNIFNYVSPAFADVSTEIELSEIKHSTVNSFYKDYEEGIRLAKLILRKFGYNISNTSNKKIKTPPFWIDMSKLFEIYTLGILRNRFYNEVLFQYSPDRSNDLDYLLKAEDQKMVIDAKYKTRYLKNKDEIDIRQVSGYARLKSVYDELKIPYNEIIDCLIIYPNQDGIETIEDNDVLKKDVINNYVNMYKLGVKLPVIQ